MRMRRSWCVCTHSSDLVGLGVMLQQKSHDVCVSLLRSLMQRSVTQLENAKGEKC